MPDWIVQIDPEAAQQAEKQHLPRFIAFVDTPCGQMTLVQRGEALSELRLQGGAKDGESLVRTPLLERAATELAEYFAGERKSFDLPLAPLGTPFMQKVWQVLVQSVPYGQTISYGELAKRCGLPKAARAVGTANHRNPLPILIPCHRVIGGDGKLVGYGGGLEIKDMLLKLESGTIPAQAGSCTPGIGRKGCCMDHRKTKIVCTLGPATESDEVLRELMLSGMAVARLNFSHGTHETHGRTMARVKRLREELGLPIAIMLDTKGPEIRIGKFVKGKVELKKGQTFTLCTDDVPGDEKQVHVTYHELPKDVKEGSTILLDDGLISLTVLSLTDARIVCRVENNGEISDQKGVNVPGAELSMPFLSEQDKDDIFFGIQHDIDFVAASFTRCAEDILEIRKLFSQKGSKDIGIIAKIENHQGVANIDEILRVSDGVMVARGDLGVEIPLEEVPVIQKRLIRKAYSMGKQVITATQMLESMIVNPRPTRAEATDVANAIYDGTSAIMLSGETAAGQYPIEALRTMARIASRAEEDINYIKRFKERENDMAPDVTNAISHATVTSAHDLGAAAILTVTKSGRTARMISKFRPNCPIICCTMDESVRRRLNLSWGVIPLKIKEAHNTDELFDDAVRAGEQAGLLHNGELVVMTAGVPLSISGTTNLMKVHVVGHILVTGRSVNRKSVRARLCVATSEEEAEKEFNDGDILVISQTSNRLLPLVRKASGLVLEDPDLNGHGSIAGMSLDIPVIVGAENATEILKSGAVVTLDAERGVVTCDSCAE